LEPYIVDGAIPAVVHEVAVPAGGATAGNGLTPGEAISVAPSGIPVPPTPMLGPMPSGEVAPSVGVGTAIPVTCAIAGPLAKNNTQAVISELFTCISDRKIRGAARISCEIFLGRGATGSRASRSSMARARRDAGDTSRSSPGRRRRDIRANIS